MGVEWEDKLARGEADGPPPHVLWHSPLIFLFLLLCRGVEKLCCRDTAAGSQHDHFPVWQGRERIKSALLQYTASEMFSFPPTPPLFFPPGTHTNQEDVFKRLTEFGFIPRR